MFIEHTIGEFHIHNKTTKRSFCLRADGDNCQHFFFLLGTASATKAMTNYIDSLLGDPQKKYMIKHFPMKMDFLGEYPDVASFLFVMSIACN